jgi:lysophospholipase L1-like esterase
MRSPAGALSREIFAKTKTENAVGEPGEGMASVDHSSSYREEPRGRGGFYLLLVSLLVIIFNRYIAFKIDLDWLNLIPLAATLYVAYSVIALDKVLGQFSFVRRSLSEEPGVRKPAGSFVLSHWVRSCIVMLLVLVACEFGLRCFSYHRSLAYERHGDLLFTPVPNQSYVEKISLTHSLINSYGLRGGPVDIGPGKEKILCLGDSITYGYGLDDAHSYPARLQAALDQEFPGHYSVLNGGVDAYPIAFEWQKFLYLWNTGVHPDVVIIGYTMNEGFLGHLVDSSEEVKDQFARRVWMKNYMRSFALYNLVAEKWAHTYYDRMKGKLVPGTNFASLSKDELDKRYDGYLTRFLADLQARKVQPVFLLMASFNNQAGTYNTQGPFEERFADFATRNGLPLLRADEILRAGDPANSDIAKYFLDPVHMNEMGTQKVATKLAEFVPRTLEKEKEGSAVAISDAKGASGIEPAKFSSEVRH